MPTFPVELVSQALKAGWSRQHVVEALLERIERDQAYLAYRVRKGLHTAYDAQTARDLEALALAATWLTEDTTQAPSPKGETLSSS
jgi:hypothetical protein